MYAPSTLILGIGNYLMGDEGVGVHVAQKMSNMNLPPHVTVVDGGTGGFYLLEYFEEYEHVIIIDATLDGKHSGTVRLIKPRYAKDFPPAMSTHDIGLKDLVSALQLLNKMPQIDLLVVSIATIQQQGIELTSEIEEKIPLIIDSVYELIQTEEKPSSKYKPVGNAVVF